MSASWLERLGEMWVIESSRPKPWSETCTVRIEDAFYRIDEVQERVDRDYPHRYCLVPIESSWLVRRVEDWPDQSEGSTPD
ncbi:MAG: hypothetical protein P1V51_13215 [Deltaproteobacteria bacterium]|nr:hypothetical protein [Deltaproteobacteria bacterium]